MVKILGTVFCTEEGCDYEEENVEMQMSCPRCKSFKIRHTPPHKILLCPNQNPEGHGRLSGKLGNIHRKIIDNTKGKEKTYRDVLKLVKSERRTWTTNEIINHFGISGLTDGDVIRVILDLLVCQGHLKKTFMKGSKYHLYDSNIPYSPCKHLSHITKGKRKNVYKCKFDFKKFGKELDSYKIFKGDIQ